MQDRANDPSLEVPSSWQRQVITRSLQMARVHTCSDPHICATSNVSVPLTNHLDSTSFPARLRQARANTGACWAHMSVALPITRCEGAVSQSAVEEGCKGPRGEALARRKAIVSHKQIRG